MNIKRGFYVQNNFWQNSTIRELTTSQRGILADLFSMLSAETRKSWWGILADNDCKPISSRAIRSELGKSRMASNTWNSIREEFLTKGIFKKINMLRHEYLYCPIFVEMNPFEGMRKTNAAMTQQTVEKSKVSKADIYLGYDPDCIAQDAELDDWGRVCRLWIELSGGRPPLSTDMSLATKEEIKADLLKMIEEFGVDNALHDMEASFEFKKRTGGRINSIEYIMARWRSRDWMKRFDSGGEIQTRRKEYDNLKNEVIVLIKQKVVSDTKQLLKHLPLANKELLEKIAKELKLK